VWQGSSETNFVGPNEPSNEAAMRLTTTGSVFIDSVDLVVHLANGEDVNSHVFDGPGRYVSPGGNGGLIFGIMDPSHSETYGPPSECASISLTVVAGGQTFSYPFSQADINGFCSQGYTNWTPTQFTFQVANEGPGSTDSNGFYNPLEPDGYNPSCGDPIACSTGNYSQSATDLTLPGLGLSLSSSRTYNSSMAAVNGPFGYGWTGSYSATLAVNTTAETAIVTEGNGATATFDDTSSGYVPAEPTNKGALAVNSDGTYTVTLPNQTVQKFSSSGQLTSESDLNGYTTSLSYNSAGRLIGVTDPEGRTFTYGYTGQDVTSISDGLGRMVSFTYDSSGNLVTATDVDGHTTHYGYGAGHLLTTWTNPDRDTVTNAYNASGQVASQTDPLGRVTKFAYDAAGTTITLPDGSQTREEFVANLLVSSTHGYGTPSASTTTYSYDTNDNIIAITDADGNTTSLSWDSNGNLLSSTDALGNTTSYTYNQHNEVTSLTDPSGVETTYAYDSNGNLTGSNTPISGTTQHRIITIGYDPLTPGVVTSYTDPDGHTTTYGHDAYGQITSITDPEGHQSTTTFNAYGQVTATVDPRGYDSGNSPAAYTTTYAHDPAGLLIQTVDPDGDKVSSTYNGEGQLLTQTDPDGNITANTYDAAGELIKTTKADNSTETYTYTPNGLMASQTDGAGDTTKYAYNSLGLLGTETLPGGQSTSYSYDPAGRLAALTNARSETTSYTYDADGELTGLTFGDKTTPAEGFSYDADGRLVGTTDGTGTSTYTYNSVGEMTAQTNGATSSSTGSTVGYGYDAAGNLTTIKYPAGLLQLSEPNGQTAILGTGSVTRGYNADEQLTSVSDWLGNTSTFAYDSAGNLTKTSYANGVTATQAYDPAGRLTQITDTDADGITLLNLPYSYDKDGNVTQTDPDLGEVPGTTEQLTYDKLGQLTGNNPAIAGQAITAATYSYDAANRLITASLAGLPTSFTYNSDSELQSTTSTLTGQTQRTFAYDADGNRTSSTNTLTGVKQTYGWDELGRLVTYRGPAASTVDGQTGQNVQLNYTYDAENLRSDLTWDRAEGLPLIIGTSTAAYVTGPGGLPLEQVSPANSVLYYQHDALGSTRLLTSQSSKVIGHYAYDAYGNQIGTKVSSILNPFMYAGQYTDPQTGLMYMRARYYDPTTASFISLDPLHDLTQEPYGYASNNPVSDSDPTGADDGDPDESPTSVFGGTGTDSGNYPNGDIDGGENTGLQPGEPSYDPDESSTTGDPADPTTDGEDEPPSCLSVTNDGLPVHSTLREAERGIDAAEVQANGDLYFDGENGNKVYVLSTGGGTNDVLIQSPEGRDVTVLILTDQQLANRLASGRYIDPNG
jgi:RHS repeat-associated protein